MGYETHVMIGFLSEPRDEWEEDKEHPYDDGSGYPPLKDKDGNPVLTGRKRRYFLPDAEIDLMTIYDTALSRLHDRYAKKAKENTKERVFFYGRDGNTRVMADRYGDPLVPVPLKKILEAAREDAEESDYRRIHWLRALLESMAEDDEKRTCIFYGT